MHIDEHQLHCSSSSNKSEKATLLTPGLQRAPPAAGRSGGRLRVGQGEVLHHEAVPRRGRPGPRRRRGRGVVRRGCRGRATERRAAVWGSSEAGWGGGADHFTLGRFLWRELGLKQDLQKQQHKELSKSSTLQLYRDLSFVLGSPLGAELTHLQGVKWERGTEN